MSRPGTKENKKLGSQKFPRKKLNEDFDDDLVEITSSDESAEDSVDEEEGEDEEEEESWRPKPKPKPKFSKPLPKPAPKLKASPKPIVEEEPDEDESEEEVELEEKPRKPRPFSRKPLDPEPDEDEEPEVTPRKPLRPSARKPAAQPPVKTRASLRKRDEDAEDEAELDDEDENVAEETEAEYDEEEFDDEEPAKPAGPSWLTIIILIAIAGFFAAFISLPILFFTNNPMLGVAAVIAIGAAVFFYFRTPAENRDSFFLSGPGLVTLGALLCLWLGGLSEFNKEKQRQADEAEAAQIEKGKQDAEAARVKAAAEALPEAAPPSRPGTSGVSVGKWTITQDDRGAYRVNGKKITGTWKLKDDNERIEFITEEEKAEIREALNKFDEQNQKK